MNKKAIIIGASSGIGREVALLLLKEGWHIGVAARREEPLQELKDAAPERVEIMTIDVTQEDAGHHFFSLVQSCPQPVKGNYSQNNNNNQIAAQKNAYHLMQNTILFST